MVIKTVADPDLELKGEGVVLLCSPRGLSFFSENYSFFIENKEGGGGVIRSATEKELLNQKQIIKCIDIFTEIVSTLTNCRLIICFQSHQNITHLQSRNNKVITSNPARTGSFSKFFQILEEKCFY